MKYFSLGIVTGLISLGILLLIISFLAFKNESKLLTTQPGIKIKSIDTMKYSRDIAREKLNDPGFDASIENQVRDIAQTGATHVAVGTPYDKEFAPFLKRWVDSARRNRLKVWFRGNFSGWEKWFDYPSIDRQTHIKMIGEFIKENPGLFEDGDIFTPCSECENGGPGDPRKTGDTEGFRNFLIDDYNTSQSSFLKINKKVSTGYFSMNYDVARTIMDLATTKALGGIVAIDHYVTFPAKLASDAKLLALQSGGQIVFGELGAPIPDLNGQMTEDEQAEWIKQALSGLVNTSEVIGINYWVNVGGSTQIWDEKGNPKKAVEVIKKFFKEETLKKTANLKFWREVTVSPLSISLFGLRQTLSNL